MAISDFYDFGPLMAQLQQGGQGMSGGLGTPQNTWNGSQFVMPQAAPQQARPHLAPYKGTAMEMNQPAQPAKPVNTFGALQGRRVTGRPGGLKRALDGSNPFLGQLMGLMG